MNATALPEFRPGFTTPAQPPDPIKLAEILAVALILAVWVVTYVGLNPAEPTCPAPRHFAAH